MTNWEEVWRFETANLAVVAEVTPEEMDPEDSFTDRQDIEDIREGRVGWFAARVRVLAKDANVHDEGGGVTYRGDEVELGSDYLGGCAYRSPDELFREHATIARRLRRLRKDHASYLSGVRRNLERGYHSGAEGYRARAAEARREIASLKRAVGHGGYGVDMVREACRRARETLAATRAIPVRAVNPSPR